MSRSSDIVSTSLISTPTMSSVRREAAAMLMAHPSPLKRASSTTVCLSFSSILIRSPHHCALFQAAVWKGQGSGIVFRSMTYRTLIALHPSRQGLNLLPPGLNGLPYSKIGPALPRLISILIVNKQF